MEMRLGLLGRTEQVALEMSRNAQASGERGNRTPAVGSTPGGKATFFFHFFFSNVIINM